MWLIAHLLIIASLSVRVLLRPNRDPASRVAWILFIMALPYIGALVYLMLGEVRPNKGLINARQTKAAWLPTNAQSSLNEPIPASAMAGFSIGQSISHFEAVNGNQGYLLDDSNATINALVTDIDAAREHVHLLFYIWLADTNGGKVVDALVRAARRGVTCRVIVDDLGSRNFIHSKHWQTMGDAGVQLARAQPIGNILLRILKGRVDIRNHRKIVVIDNQITYCGSQNCADPEFAIKAKYAPWVDAVIRLQGPVARQNQQLFLTDWLICTNQDYRELAQLPMPPTEPGFLAQAIGTGPQNHYSATPELFATLMFSAQKELIITTPYYVPDDFMQAALCSSARRGVATSIILPARNDSWFVGAASRSHYAELLEAGVRIHEYTKGLLHAKTLTVDGEITLIGSANMDRRSFDLNFENNILLHNEVLTQAIRHRQHEYISQSNPVEKADVSAWPWTYRLRNNLMAILSPVL